MDDHVARPRRALVGVAAMAVGAAGLVGGLASTAAAHEGTEPVPTDDIDCAGVAEEVGSDQTWTEYDIEGFPEEEGDYPFTLSDRGTPDVSDDAMLTIHVNGPKNFDWDSNEGIDAVVTHGADEEYGSYYYYFEGDELTEDVDYTVPPYEHQDKNSIAGISFCWDDETPPPTTSSTTSSTVPPTSSTSSSTTSSTVAPTSSTSSTVAPTSSTIPSTTTTVRSSGGLPVTGSNTGLLAGIGGGLLLAGGIFLVAKRQLWRRPV